MRRVGLFDLESVKRACRFNGATRLALMGADRYDHKNRGILEWSGLTDMTKSFIYNVKEEIFCKKLS